MSAEKSKIFREVGVTTADLHQYLSSVSDLTGPAVRSALNYLSSRGLVTPKKAPLLERPNLSGKEKYWVPKIDCRQAEDYGRKKEFESKASPVERFVLLGLCKLHNPDVCTYELSDLRGFNFKERLWKPTSAVDEKGIESLLRTHPEIIENLSAQDLSDTLKKSGLDFSPEKLTEIQKSRK
jgi:hypothetical protein